MKFGVAQGEEPAYDPEATGGAGGSYIKYFKDKATTLRFLEEIKDWTSVWMHFSQGKSRDYPCTDERATCPGHNSENEREAKASKRYIVNALNVDTGYVDLYKIPYSLIDDLMRQSEKFGTIMDRDYTIYKAQESGQTKYSVDREEKAEIDLAPYLAQMRDHQPALQDAFREVWGALPDEDGYTGGLMASEGISNSGYLKPLDKPRPIKMEVVPDPPTEPAAQQEEEQREITEVELRGMTEDQVIEVYKIAGVPVPTAYKDNDQLVNMLIAALS